MLLKDIKDTLEIAYHTPTLLFIELATAQIGQVAANKCAKATPYICDDILVQLFSNFIFLPDYRIICVVGYLMPGGNFEKHLAQRILKSKLSKDILSFCAVCLVLLVSIKVHFI